MTNCIHKGEGWFVQDEGDSVVVVFEGLKPGVAMAAALGVTDPSTDAIQRQGVEAYRLNKPTYQRTFATLICPALEHRIPERETLLWTLDQGLQPDGPCLPVLELLQGRLRPLDSLQSLDPVLSRIFIEYVKEAWVAPSGRRKVSLVSWALELSNVLFVLAKSMQGLNSWIYSNKDMLEETFQSGLGLLADAAPSLGKPRDPERLRMLSSLI